MKNLNVLFSLPQKTSTITLLQKKINTSITLTQNIHNLKYFKTIKLYLFYLMEAFLLPVFLSLFFLPSHIYVFFLHLKASIPIFYLNNNKKRKKSKLRAITSLLQVFFFVCK